MDRSKLGEVIFPFFNEERKQLISCLGRPLQGPLLHLIFTTLLYGMMFFL